MKCYVLISLTTLVYVNCRIDFVYVCVCAGPSYVEYGKCPRDQYLENEDKVSER